MIWITILRYFVTSSLKSFKYHVPLHLHVRLRSDMKLIVSNIYNVINLCINIYDWTVITWWRVTKFNYLSHFCSRSDVTVFFSKYQITRNWKQDSHQKRFHATNHFFLTCLWLWSLRRIKALFWFDSKAYQNVKFNKGSSFLESRIFFKFFDMLLICVIISGGSQIWCFEWFLEKGALFCP